MGMGKGCTILTLMRVLWVAVGYLQAYLWVPMPPPTQVISTHVSMEPGIMAGDAGNPKTYACVTQRAKASGHMGCLEMSPQPGGCFLLIELLSPELKCGTCAHYCRVYKCCMWFIMLQEVRLNDTEVCVHGTLVNVLGNWAVFFQVSRH
jgi:hypothetical protein